jgi:hypothetical protein
MIRRRSVINQQNNRKGILIRPSDSLLFFTALLILASCFFLGVSTTFSDNLVAASPSRIVSLARSNRQFGVTVRFLQSATSVRGGQIIPPNAKSDNTTATPVDLSSTMTTNTTQDTANSTATTMTSTPKWTWADARRTLFPIYGEKEVTKFLLIGSIKFFIILALTLTRDTKDTLVVTQCGAEAIAFLKVCMVVLDNY